MEASVHSLVPTTPLRQGERVVESFHPDKQAYLWAHVWLAVAAMALGMAILWAIGNPYVWTGGVGGLAAVGLRGWYVASDELNVRWDLTNRRLLGPQSRAVPLPEIDKLRTLGSAVQIVTKGGDKHLLKFQADPAETKARIKAEMGRSTG
jgi:hypothetical protein